MEAGGLPTNEEEQFGWIEDLFKELRRLGCYDIKFEKDSKFHTEFSNWKKTLSSHIVIEGKPLPEHIVSGAILIGVNVLIVDRSLEKDTFKHEEDESK